MHSQPCAGPTWRPSRILSPCNQETDDARAKLLSPAHDIRRRFRRRLVLDYHSQRYASGKAETKLTTSGYCYTIDYVDTHATLNSFGNGIDSSVKMTCKSV